MHIIKVLECPAHNFPTQIIIRHDADCPFCEHSGGRIIAVSGGFDPIHVGHIHYLEEAKSLGDVLVVILNTDEWLVRKKGYVFMPFKERATVLLATRYVDVVFKSVDADTTVARSLELLNPHVFAKGGDRLPENMPKEEIEVCRRLGIRIAYGVGGGKVQSSSWLIEKLLKKFSEQEVMSQKLKMTNH